MYTTKIIDILTNFYYTVAEHFIFLASDAHWQEAQSLMAKLQHVLSNDNPGLHGCLPHINATLKKLILTCNAACIIKSGVNVSLSNKEQIAPGKKMELQLRFTSTAKTPGRKKKNTL